MTVPAAPAAAPAPADGGLFTPTHLGGGLALIALVGGGAWFMQRRRGSRGLMPPGSFEDDSSLAKNPLASLEEEFDEPTAVDADVEEATAEVSFGESEDELPEANVVDEFASAEGDEEAEETVVMASSAADTAPQADLFDTAVSDEASPTADMNMPGDEAAGAAGDDDMEAYGDTVTTGMGATPPAAASAGVVASDDAMRMLREFEQRMANLETRLDEMGEAKERLERQVAAQTEELRVQRAAIARTQRALRNLSRSDDESPTEPALRGEPNA